MSSFVPLEEAQARLRQIIEEMYPGQRLYITQDDHPIAEVVRMPPRLTEPRRPGSAVGELVIVEDDDSHLEDFKEYME